MDATEVKRLQAQIDFLSFALMTVIEQLPRPSHVKAELREQIALAEPEQAAAAKEWGERWLPAGTNWIPGLGT